MNLACWTGQEKIALLLLGGNPDPNVVCERTDPKGQTLQSTALWWAAHHGLANLCHALLDHGAMTNLGESPLNEAASEEIRNMLLESQK